MSSQTTKTQATKIQHDAEMAEMGACFCNACLDTQIQPCTCGRFIWATQDDTDPRVYRAPHRDGGQTQGRLSYCCHSGSYHWKNRSDARRAIRRMCEGK